MATPERRHCSLIFEVKGTFFFCYCCWKFFCGKDKLKPHNLRVQEPKPMVIFKSVQVFSYLFLKCLAGYTNVPHVVQTVKPILRLPELQYILPVESVVIWPPWRLFPYQSLGESNLILEPQCFYVFVSVWSVSALELSIGAKPEPPWAVFHIVCSWQLDSELPRLGSKQYTDIICSSVSVLPGCDW